MVSKSHHLRTFGSYSAGGGVKDCVLGRADKVISNHTVWFYGRSGASVCVLVLCLAHSECLTVVWGEE